MIIKLLLPFAVFYSFQVFAAEVQPNFENWLKLHRTHMRAQRALTPNEENPGEKFSKTEFDSLVKDSRIRELYTQRMDGIVEECSARLDLKECQELLTAVEEGDLGICLGAENFKFASDSLFTLNDEVAEIIQVRSQSGNHTKYSESPQVASMITRLRRNLTLNCTVSGCSGKRAPGSKGKCLRYVKLGVMAGGFTRSYSGTKFASDFGRDLKAMGFRNLKDSNQSLSARSAPKGAILVYSGGCCGHIEVKAGANEFLSDFSSRRPVDEYLGRKLIGVYVK